MAKDDPVKWEKMSKSRGNVIRPEEVVYCVYELDNGYEFRNWDGEVIDWKAWGVWRDALNTNDYFTSSKKGKWPVFLCQRDNFDEEGLPIPCILLRDGKEHVQHEKLIETGIYVMKKEDKS